MAEQLDVVTAPPGPTPISAQPQPPPMNDQEVRAAVMKAEAEGKEVAEIPAQTSGLDRILPTVPSTPDVPVKFLKPDGTVDVQKILDSSKQLDADIEKKQLSV